MELRATVAIRNKETGSETIIGTYMDPSQALTWVDFSMKNLDPNDMPEYVIRPIIRKESQHGNVATAKQVQKPQG